MNGPPAARRPAWKLLAPLALLAALMVLEILRGARRIEEVQARHEGDLVALLEREQARLAREIEGLFGDGAGHARYLARAPLVHELLNQPDAERRATLEKTLLPYVAGFRGLDRVAVLDERGRELVRCERSGGGVAILPPDLLDPGPDAVLLRLAGSVAPGQAAVSALMADEERVEVSAAERRVFHYVAPVLASGSTRGAVAVTAYAAPLLHALQDFGPVPGTWSALFDSAEGLFAAADGELAPASPDLADIAALAHASASPEGTRIASVQGRTLLVTELENGPAALLVTAVPSAALARAAGLAPSERLSAASTSVLTLLAIALLSALFVRQSLRAERLRETEAFLARLAEETRRYRALMEASADVLLVLSPRDGELFDWNAHAGTLFGLGAPPSAPAGRESLERVLRAFAPEARGVLAEALETALATPGRAVERTELSLSPPAGRPRVLDLRCVALEYGGLALVEAALLDRTREREMERRMQTTERLSSLGLLTAGVAHEINNPLAGIVNYVALLERGTPDEEKRAHYLRQVRAGLERIRGITSDLLSFGQSPADSGVLDLSQAVEGALSMARMSRALNGIAVERLGLGAPLPVCGSAGRVEQVLLNLFLNAARAMNGKGTLALTASHDDGYAVLTVADSGPGIAKEDLARIFDPFFSRSGSTGLGLAVSYGIVRALGGELTAANRPEGGAAFDLRLRLAKEVSAR